MIDFDKYKELYQGDFSKAITDVSATAYSQTKLRQREQEHQLQGLFEFVKLWKDRYVLFCENFDSYSYIEQNMPIWSTGRERSERGYVPLPKSEFYIDEFFNMILNKRAKFEIQQYRQNYSPEYDNSGRIYEYSKQPDQNIIISGNKFTIIGKDNNYRLDIKMNSALICSLLCSLSNNHNIYKFYHKSSKFRDFIDKISTSHYFVEFQVENHYSRVLINGGTKEPHLRIDSERGWVYFIYQSEIIRIENQVHYNHLDDLFGKGRTKPLTSEDLELYHMLNGKYPSMYDFDIQC